MTNEHVDNYSLLLPHNASLNQIENVEIDFQRFIRLYGRKRQSPGHLSLN